MVEARGVATDGGQGRRRMRDEQGGLLRGTSSVEIRGVWRDPWRTLRVQQDAGTTGRVAIHTRERRDSQVGHRLFPPRPEAAT